jgi:deoxyribonuclease-4
MLLGCHLSTAGGLDKALTAAAGYGFDAMGLFVRGHLRWQTRPLGDEEAGRFRRLRRRLAIGPIVAHGSYLVNLAAEGTLRRQSLRAVLDELERCGRLGVEYLVYHPGSASDESAAPRRVADSLNEVLAACPFRRPKILLETTAGQGESLGWRLEHLAEILAGLERPQRVGVCLDTCHVFAAGYEIHTAAGCRRLMEQLDGILGFSRLEAIHLNDSKAPCGRRVDRHEHVGRGRIGLKAFARLVNDPRLAEVPMILETPKGKDRAGRDWDEINAETVRGLVVR